MSDSGKIIGENTARKEDKNSLVRLDAFYNRVIREDLIIR